jgi:hypothetical protein
MVLCGLAWMNSSGSTGKDSWVRWSRIYVEDYLGQPLALPEWHRRVATIHDYELKFPGFDYSAEYIDSSASPPYASRYLSRSLAVHYGLLAVLAALPLAVYIIFTRGRFRAVLLLRRGLCPKCGYDLRAHAHGEKCPECGTPKDRR